LGPSGTLEPPTLHNFANSGTSKHEKGREKPKKGRLRVKVPLQKTVAGDTQKHPCEHALVADRQLIPLPALGLVGQHGLSRDWYGLHSLATAPQIPQSQDLTKPYQCQRAGTYWSNPLETLDDESHAKPVVAGI
jgi:hypothetical protein